MKTKIQPVGFQCQEDCTLDSTNFYGGEIITIPIDDVPNDWKGVEWFESHPQIFKPVYAVDAPELIAALNSLVLSVMAHPDYVMDENQEFIDLVDIASEALEKVTQSA